MAEKRTILIDNTAYDATHAANYHHGQFPPQHLDLMALIGPLTDTVAALARYDTMLGTLQNSELLLAPLRARDAVVSSRMEGTISTIEEVLRLEAEADARGLPQESRNETREVALYARALRQMEQALRDGYPLSESLIQSAHRTLLSAGRGANKNPGAYKVEQNYIGDKYQRRIDFIPISPEQIAPAMADLVGYMRNESPNVVLRTAVAHVEFEALHPFEDGNGRMGRMLIPLMLWQGNVLQAPHFFVSDYFELHKDEYIARMRAVSQQGDWSGWCAFFLTALQSQAQANIRTLQEIQALYAASHERLRNLYRSPWTVEALNYIFANPIFHNGRFVREAGIPRQTAHAFTRAMVEDGMLETVVPPAGRAAGIYAMPELLALLS